MIRILTAFLMMVISLSTFSQSIENIDLTKKERNKIKRYIHPKTKFISISAGLGFTSTNFKDPNNFFINGMILQNNTTFPNITYEHGIRDNFFAEIGYNFIGQGVTIGRKIDEDVSFSYYRNYYSNHDIQLGIGYRVITENNFNLFNLHAGLFIGVSNLNKLRFNELIKDTAYISVNEPQTNEKYLIIDNINSLSRISFGPYLGLSKDIRISKNVRLFFKYVHRFGLSKTLDGSIRVFNGPMNFNPITEATYNMRGGGAFISGGIKISIFSRNLVYEY